MRVLRDLRQQYVLQVPLRFEIAAPLRDRHCDRCHCTASARSASNTCWYACMHAVGVVHILPMQAARHGWGGDGGRGEGAVDEAQLRTELAREALLRIGVALLRAR